MGRAGQSWRLIQLKPPLLNACISARFTIDASKHFAFVNVSSENMSCMLLDSEIIQCIQYGQREAVRDALRQGADPNSFDLWTAKSFLQLAGECGQSLICRDLVMAGADVNERVGRLQEPILCRAIANHNFGFAAELIECGADVNLQGRFGMTPLSLAARDGNEFLVERLVKGGANPSTSDNQGRNTYHIAAKYGTGRMMKLLVRHDRHGVDACDRTKRTPFDVAVHSSNSEVAEVLLQLNANKVGGSPHSLGNSLRAKRTATNARDYAL